MTLPPLNGLGGYRWPDGSTVSPSAGQKQKWVATAPDGSLVRMAGTLFFDTPFLAAAALLALKVGPGANDVHS